MTKRALERITITIPQPILEAADQLAAQLDRSRSWVLTEAVRRMVGMPAPAELPPASPLAAIPVPSVTSIRPVEERLRKALALSPLARLQAAEEAARVARGGQKSSGSERIRAFPSQQEYEQWRSGGRVTG